MVETANDQETKITLYWYVKLDCLTLFVILNRSNYADNRSFNAHIIHNAGSDVKLTAMVSG